MPWGFFRLNKYINQQDIKWEFIVGRWPLSAKHTVLPPKNQCKISFCLYIKFKIIDKPATKICYIFAAGASPCPTMNPNSANRQIFILSQNKNLFYSYTVTFWTSLLLRPLGLCTEFLSVRLRFRYCFFSPTSHDVKLASRFRVGR